MQWSDLNTLPCSSIICSINTSDPKHEFTSARLWDEACTPTSDELLFIHQRDLNRLQSRKGLSVLVCLDGQDEDVYYRINDFLNLASLRTQEDIVQVFNAVCDLLRLETKATLAINHLYQMVSEGAGLQAITDQIAELYRNPVSIIDPSYTYLAASNNYESTNPILSDEKKRGYLDRDVIRSEQFQTTFFARETKEPQSVELHGIRNHFVNIYSGDVIIGSLSIFESLHPIYPRMLKYMSQIAAVVSLQMQKMDYHQVSRFSYYTHIFSTILNSSELPEEDIETRLRVYGYNIKELKYLLYINVNDLPKERAKLQTLAKSMVNSLDNAIFAIEPDYLVFMITCDKSDPLTPSKVTRLSNILKLSSLKAGISSAHTDLTQARSHLEEARLALKTGIKIDPKQNVYFYDAYRIFAMVQTLNKSEALSIYCYPPVLKLIHYEEGRENYLVTTLFHYLQDPHHPAAVAQKLYIHKNTLFYRLHQIKAVMGVDLEDSFQITQICLTFAILRYWNVLNLDRNLEEPLGTGSIVH